MHAFKKGDRVSVVACKVNSHLFNPKPYLQDGEVSRDSGPHGVHILLDNDVDGSREFSFGPDWIIEPAHNPADLQPDKDWT